MAKRTFTLEILDPSDPLVESLICAQCGEPTRVQWRDDADDKTPIGDCGSHAVSDSVRVAAPMT